MKKPIIAVDIDDVLLPHFQDLIDWYNNQYGTSLTLADNEKGVLEAWGVQRREDAIRRVQGFFATPAFRAEKPFEEAKSILERLSKQYQLIALTGRDHMLEVTTRDWIAEHFGALVTDVYFTAYYNLEGKARTKAEVCQELGVDYLIDDSLRHARPVAEAGITVILFGDYPWNQIDKLPPNVVRCPDWKAVQEYFDGR